MGTGYRGSMASRRTRTLKPTTVAARNRLQARRENARSTARNQELPSLGQAKAEASAMAVSPHSSMSSDGFF